MKKVSLVISFILILSIFIAPTNAFAVDATSRIQIYYQQYASTNSWSKLKLSSGETMGTAGCLIFSYAHAIQWFTGEKVTGTYLLESMIKEGSSPWSYGIGYYAGKSTCKGRGIYSTGESVSTSNITTILGSGKVILANTSFKGKAAGHYILAVEYTTRDVDGDGKADTLIHVVDSAMQSTYRRVVAENANDRNKGHYARGYSMYNFSTFNKITSQPSEQGGQYWIKASDFISAMDKARLVLSHTSVSPASTLEFRDVKYPSTYNCTVQSGKSTSAGFNIGGLVVSNKDLVSINAVIKKSDGTVVSSMSSPYTLHGKYFFLSALDDGSSTDHGNKFSKITSEGTYYWYLTAVDSDGRTLPLTPLKITAQKGGSTVASTSSGSYSGQTVNVTGVSLNKTSLTLDAGKNETLTATIAPSNANNQSVTWSSNNTSVATVDSTGKVTAKAAGSATITVTTADGGKTATCSVTVRSISGTCGANMNWSYSNGTLSITGSGDMYQYYDSSPAPWNNYKSSITNITFGSGVKSISMEAFMGYTSVTSVTLPNTLVEIGQSAFEGCKNLRQITIPASVTEIPTCAFTGCTSLSSVTFNSAISYFGYEAFKNCISLTSITIPNGSGIIGDSAFSGCTKLSTASIPSSVYLISSTAFANCSKLTINCDYDSTAYNYAITNGISYHLNEVIVESIAFDQESVTIHLGATQYVGGLWVTPTNATFGYFIWDSSNPSVATVNSSGDVTAHALGTTVISATTSVGGKRAECVVTVVSANGSCGDNVEWSYNNGTLTISGTGDMYDYRVWSLTPWYDYYEEINYVSVGEGVTSLGKDAFHNCYNLHYVDLPSTLVRIGQAAFYHCENLQYINIPDAVTTIEYAAFAYCYSIPYVFLPNGLTTLPEACFNNCTSLTSVSLPSVTEIGDTAFAHCDSLVDVHITGPIQNIGYGVFAVCGNLSKVTITTDQQVTFGTDIFTNSPNVTVYCQENTSTQSFVSQNSIPYVIIGGNAGSGIKWFFIDGTFMIYGEGAMENYSSSTRPPWYHLRNSIEYIYVLEGITTIGDSAFEWCSNATYVSLPNTLTSIGEFAFCSCNGLTTISLPDGLQSIGNCAFDLCDNITSITIPASVNSIHSSAFFRCKSLLSLSVDTNNQSYCSIDGIVYSKDMTTLVRYPAGRQGAYTIPSSVTTIGWEAFSYCNWLTTITIPKNVRSIGGYVFEHCDALTSIYIEEGVTTIGIAAIRYCDNLTDVYVPYSVTNYDDYGSNSVFTYCDNITVHAPSGSTTETYVNNLGINFVPSDIYAYGSAGNNIDWCLVGTEFYVYGTGEMYSYSEATSQPWYVYHNIITKVVVCDGVTTIGNSAFEGFTAISEIDLPVGLQSIGSRSFRLCSNMTNIDIPYTVTSIGRTAFDGCYNLQSFVFPEGINGSDITTIAYRTFHNCYSIKYYSLPEGLRTIEQWAFLNNTGLEWILIPKSVTTIDDLAFEGCGSVKIYCWEGSTAHTFAQNHSMSYSLLDTPIENPDFVLPASTTVIEAEAFCGIPAKRIMLSQNVTSIGSKAFANCGGLTGIYIPRSCTSIAANAFSGVSSDFTIYGCGGSAAETYASDHGYGFVAVE